MGSYVGTEGWSKNSQSKARSNSAGANERANGSHHQGYAAEATSQDGIFEMERREGLKDRTDATIANEPYMPQAQASHTV